MSMRIATFDAPKCCILHEWPLRRAALQCPEVDVNGTMGRSRRRSDRAERSRSLQNAFVSALLGQLRCYVPNKSARADVSIPKQVRPAGFTVGASSPATRAFTTASSMLSTAAM